MIAATTYIQTPQPATIRVLRRLIAEARAAGVEHLPVSAIETALDRIETQ